MKVKTILLVCLLFGISAISSIYAQSDPSTPQTPPGELVIDDGDSNGGGLPYPPRPSGVYGRTLSELAIRAVLVDNRTVETYFLQDTKKYRIEVKSLNGTRVYNKVVNTKNNPTHTIDLAKFATSTYTILFTDMDSGSVKKTLVTID